MIVFVSQIVYELFCGTKYEDLYDVMDGEPTICVYHHHCRKNATHFVCHNAYTKHRFYQAYCYVHYIMDTHNSVHSFCRITRNSYLKRSHFSKYEIARENDNQIGV